MSLYIAKGVQTVAAKSALGILATAAVRPRVKKIKGFNVGAVSVDSQVEVLCQRITTAGTSSAVTPAPTDPNDPAATIIAGSNYSAEPTVTSNTLFATLAFNPRAGSNGAEWVSDGPDADIILPASANNGFAALLNTLGGGVNIYVEARVQQ